MREGPTVSGISGAFEMPTGPRLGLSLLCWLELNLKKKKIVLNIWGQEYVF